VPKADKQDVEQRLEARVLAVEEANRQLLSEIAQLRRQQVRAGEPRPSGPRPPQKFVGQGDTLIDHSGNRLVGEAVASQTTVGVNSGGLSAWRTVDGRRIFAPDGVERDLATGLPVSHARPGTADAAIPQGPTRSGAHEASVRLLDAMFPIGPKPQGG
jgi:hypothetical protein